MVAGDWRSLTRTGDAGDLHAADLPFARAAWLCVPNGAALVIGSSQSDGDVDVVAARSRGITVHRRRTGGGAVWVHPEDSIWIDVTIPRDDPLWIDDVGMSMLWLGRAWADALQPHVGESELVVYPGPFRADRWGAVVCFAGVAPGEVLVGWPGGADGSEALGKKLVGISQRRGRDGARFQCVVYRLWRPDQWIGLLKDPAARSAAMDLAVQTVTAAPALVIDSLVSRLNSGETQ